LQGAILANSAFVVQLLCFYLHGVRQVGTNTYVVFQYSGKALRAKFHLPCCKDMYERRFCYLMLVKSAWESWATYIASLEAALQLHLSCIEGCSILCLAILRGSSMLI
jgi:hypothetical protein